MCFLSIGSALAGTYTRHSQVYQALDLGHNFQGSNRDTVSHKVQASHVRLSIICWQSCMARTLLDYAMKKDLLIAPKAEAGWTGSLRTEQLVFITVYSVYSIGQI